jgi:hypothetical protein
LAEWRIYYIQLFQQVPENYFSRTLPGRPEQRLGGRSKRAWNSGHRQKRRFAALSALTNRTSCLDPRLPRGHLWAYWHQLLST